MTDSTTAAAIESLASRRVLVPPLHVLKHGKKQDPEEDVYRTVDIPILLDGSSAWPRDAKSWGQVKLSEHPHPILFFLQLMLLLVESLQHEGGWDCNVSSSNKKLYDEVVAATAKCQRNKASAMDRQLKERYVLTNCYVHLRFIHDVRYQMEYQEWLDNARRLARGRAGGKSKKPRNEPEPDLTEQEAEGPVVDQEEREPFLTFELYVAPVYPNVDEVPNLLYWNFDGTRSTRPGDGTVMDTFSDAQLEYGADYRDRLAVPRPSDVDEINRQKRAIADPTAIDPPPVYKPFVGVERVSKIDFTVSQFMDKEDKTRVQGLLCRFIIRDEAINPGTFFDAVVRNAEYRLSGSKSRFGPSRELFPMYATMGRLSHHHPAALGTRPTRTMYGQLILQLDPTLQGDKPLGVFFKDMQYTDGNSPTHLFKIFSTANALKMLADGGCNMDKVSRTSDWINYRTNTATFPLTTYKFTPQQAMWYHSTYIGLSEYFFPHVDTSSDFIKRLCKGENLEQFFSTGKFVDQADAQKQVNDAFSSLERTLTDHVQVSRDKVTKSKLITYDTTNEVIHKTAEAKVIYERVAALFPAHYHDTLKEVQRRVAKSGRANWREFDARAHNDTQVSYDDFIRRVKECDYYNATILTTQATLTKTYESLFQLTGDIDALPISYTARTMLKWFRDNQSTRFPHVSREYVSWDPELDTFGNTQLQQMSCYIHMATILQPMISMLSEGLFSSYDHFKTELSFHLMVHGRYDTGKTFTAIENLLEYTCIPDTVKKRSIATKAADTTRNHSYDEIVATDECPRWLTSKKEAEKFPELVDKAKQKMTGGELVHQGFVFVTLPDGNRVRWNEETVTDNKNACVFVTNANVEAKDALSSRTFRITVKQSRTPVSELKLQKADPRIKADTRIFLNLNQFLSYLAKKAAAVGMILPEVEMSTFLLISSKVINYLSSHNHIGKDVGPRSMGIMTPYVRQLVYKMAIRHTFDLPSSPHFKKPFEVAMLRDIQPYLYCTTSMVWWAWTACASEWIDEDHSNVIRAMIRDLGITWPDHESAYSVFERDIGDKVKFRTHENTKYVKATNGENHEDAELIDLNYLTLEGTLEQICDRLVPLTDPQMSSSDIRSVIERLSKHQHRLERNGYARYPKKTFTEWHRYVTLPSADGTVKGTKRLSNVCPPEYNLTKSSTDEKYRCEDDVDYYRPLDTVANLPAIDISDVHKHKKLHFIPSAGASFKQEVIRKALIEATLCINTKPGKFLLGQTHPEHETRLRVHKFDQQDIDTFVADMDRHMGFVYDRAHGLRYKDPSVPEDLRPVSRRVGLCFNNRAAMTEYEATCMTAVPWAPKPEGDESWRVQYAEGAKAMSQTRIIVADLDVYAAERQHMLSGRPLDEPVRTPEWIMSQYRAEKDKKQEAHDLNMDYPHDTNADRNRLDQSFGAVSTPTDLGGMQVTEKTFRTTLETSDRPRKRHAGARGGGAVAQVVRR